MIGVAEVQPQGCVTETVRGKTHGKWVTVSELLDAYGVNQRSEEKEQALHQCPPLVRAAMVGHMQLWFLARSYSPIVRTFAHAVSAATNQKHGVPSLGITYSQAGARGVLVTARHMKAGRDRRLLPYRVLHYFGNFLAKASAAGAKAELMAPNEWVESVRCNPSVRATHRDNDTEVAYGSVARISQDYYEEALQAGSMVRSNVGRMQDFCAAASMVMQPFLGGEMSFMPHCTVAPMTFVNRPRSDTTKTMIPRYLAYGMEQLAEELPLAVRWIQSRTDCLRYVTREARKYAETREDEALKAMAARDNVSDWLHQYDTVAALHWSTPTVESREVSMRYAKFNEPAFNHIPTLEIPGLCVKRWQD